MSFGVGFIFDHIFVFLIGGKWPCCLDQSCNTT